MQLTSKQDLTIVYYFYISVYFAWLRCPECSVLFIVLCFLGVIMVIKDEYMRCLEQLHTFVST